MDAGTWWYLEELKRKTSSTESDISRLDQLLARPGLDDRTRNRLKRERECEEIRLSKLKRGLLY